MKRKSVIVFATLAMLLAGCAKNSDLQSLTDRVSALEQKETLSEQEIAELTTVVAKLKEDKVAIDTKIAELEKSGEAAADKIESLKTQSEELARQIDEILGSFINRLQSVVVVPTYNDGSVRITPVDTTVVAFEISPVSAAKALVGMDDSKDYFNFQITSVETKATNFYTFDISSVRMDSNDELVEVVLAPILDGDAGIVSDISVQARLKVEALKDQAGYVCKTSTYFPLSFEENEIKKYVHHCDSLIFMNAVKPENGKNGRIAHWHCPDCNKNYLDASGTMELKTLPFLPERCHSIPTMILRHCNDFLPWQEKSETKAAGAVVKKILGIVSKVVTISFQMSTRSSLDAFADTFGDICSDLGEIQQDLNELNSKINNILAYLDSYDDKATVQEVYDYLTILAPRTISYLETFEELTAEYQSGARTEDSYRQALLGGVEKWAEESTVSGTLKEITEELMRIFVYNLRETQGEAFPKVLKDYVNFYRYWDDEGYNDRMQFLRYYETTVALSELLCQIYVNDCVEYVDDAYRRQDSTSLANSFAELPTRITADSTNMAKAYGLYRCFHDNDVTFRLDPQVRSASLYDYFNSHFDDGNFVTDCREHMDDRLLDFMAEKLVGGLTQADILASTQFVTDDDINRIYSAGHTSEDMTLTQIFAEHEMDMNPYSLAEPLIFTWRRNESLHDYSDVAGSTFHNWAEGYGFEMDHQAKKHGWYWSYDKDHYDHYCTEATYLWTDYCHDNNNNVPKHTDSDDDDLRLTVISSLHWTGWPNSENCYTCDHSRIYRYMGNDIDSRAKYQVTFRYYQGTEIPD